MLVFTTPGNTLFICNNKATKRKKPARLRLREERLRHTVYGTSYSFVANINPSGNAYKTQPPLWGSSVVGERSRKD